MSDMKETFTNIYDNGIWGKSEGFPYCSGGGSHDEKVIRPYIDLVISLIKDKGIKTICDIGCGDFNIMSQVLPQTDYDKYYGVDVVDGLIDYNNEKYGNDKISFLCADASDESQEIPGTDLLIIRQVLQHLDNASIARILKRSEKYKYVLVTEHLPFIPLRGFNKDKPINNSIRLNNRSGVYIERKPFGYKCKHLLSVESFSRTKIRTSLITNAGK